MVGSNCGPLVREVGCPLTSPSPDMTTPASGTWKAQWPAVWPGVCTGTGRPGRSSALAGERPRLGHRDVGGAAGAQRVHGPRHHAGTPGVLQHLADGHLVEEVPARVRDFGLVGVDRRAVRVTQVLGRADVVVVGVRDEYGRDRFGRTAHGRQGGEDALAVSGVARVHEGDGVPLRENHPVGVAAVYQMDAVGDLMDVCLHDRPDLEVPA